VNRHLATLTDSWERGGLPLHMNLAVHHASPAPHDILTRLKQQNHLLTEVTSTLIWEKTTWLLLLTMKPNTSCLKQQNHLYRGDTNTTKTHKTQILVVYDASLILVIWFCNTARLNKLVSPTAKSVPFAEEELIWNIKSREGTWCDSVFRCIFEVN